MTNAVPPAPSTDQPTDQPTWQQTHRPQLRRSSTERMVGGVSGGLADYSGIDTVLWRVGFVALTLAGGAGILVYLLLWVFMPAGPPVPGEVPSPLEQQVQRLNAKLSGGRTTPPAA
jgi:phage shock protein PspC (stress-responsive transcriptional regulator)